MICHSAVLVPLCLNFFHLRISLTGIPWKQSQFLRGMRTRAPLPPIPPFLSVRLSSSPCSEVPLHFTSAFEHPCPHRCCFIFIKIQNIDTRKDFSQKTRKRRRLREHARKPFFYLAFINGEEDPERKADGTSPTKTRGLQKKRRIVWGILRSVSVCGEGLIADWYRIPRSGAASPSLFSWICLVDHTICLCLSFFAGAPKDGDSAVDNGTCLMTNLCDGAICLLIPSHLGEIETSR